MVLQFTLYYRDTSITKQSSLVVHKRKLKFSSWTTLKEKSRKRKNKNIQQSWNNSFMFSQCAITFCCKVLCANVSLDVSKGGWPYTTRRFSIGPETTVYYLVNVFCDYVFRTSLRMSYRVGNGHHALRPKLVKSVSSLQTISKLRSETFNKFLQFQEFL